MLTGAHRRRRRRQACPISSERAATRSSSSRAVRRRWCRTPTASPGTATTSLRLGDLVEDLTHNFFLETGARNNKLKVYEMVDHPAARALTGYLLVRGGVHQVAYARAHREPDRRRPDEAVPVAADPDRQDPRVPAAPRTGRAPEALPLLPGRLSRARRRLQRHAPRDGRARSRSSTTPPEGVPAYRPARAAGASSRPTTRPRRSPRSRRKLRERGRPVRRADRHRGQRDQWRDGQGQERGRLMATLTNLESKLAEVLGLAMAAQDAAQQVRGMLGPEHAALAKRLAKARDEARETQKRCTALAGTFKGKKTAILESARETKQEATEMREAYLGGEDRPARRLRVPHHGRGRRSRSLVDRRPSSTRRRATRSCASSRTGPSRSSNDTSRRRSTAP